MAETTGIEWADHTANFWWGCMKVSPGCANCYAETWSKRYGRDIWGPAATTARWRTKGPWRDILRWDARAAADGVRRRVFVQSMSDFFEEHPQLDEWRAEASAILAGLKHLDVQLLTKRPENIRRMVPAAWLEQWPAHIWVGTSVENQEQADRRIPLLLEVPAAVWFLSCEPLLGPVDLTNVPLQNGASRPIGSALVKPAAGGWINWVSAGGESGPKARPMHPAWARSLRDQCQEAGVAFHFKQHGEWVSQKEWHEKPAGITDMPWYDLGDSTRMLKVGKRRAGRLLDGREWNEFPETNQ
jgi:protein gp37